MLFSLYPRSSRLRPVDSDFGTNHLDEFFWQRRDSPPQGEPQEPDRSDDDLPDPDEGEGELPPDEPVNDDEPLALWGLKITQAAYQETMRYLLSRPPEAAGILLGPANEDVLATHFIPDTSGRATAVSFALDAKSLNRTLMRHKPVGLNCKGIVHSHPPGLPQPSSGDMTYFRRLFAMPKNAFAGPLFVPIVCRGRLFNFAFARGTVFPADLILV
jgi:proteasome lid subunit RPN8/RPN11